MASAPIDRLTDVCLDDDDDGAPLCNCICLLDGWMDVSPCSARIKNFHNEHNLTVVWFNPLCSLIPSYEY